MTRQCIKLNEFKIILDDLRKQTDVISEGTDYHYESKMRKHFYWVTFRHFKKYLVFVGEIYKKYGKKIDIRSYYESEHTLTMYVRGLEQELGR